MMSTMTTTPANIVVFKIVPTTQKYDWGKTGKSSKVAQFASASQIPGFTIDEVSPYAELWMGTHPSSPSRLRLSNRVLSEYLSGNPQLIGKEIIEKFRDAENGNLPFLFKVLSIAKALSIQTHPDKKTAEILHAQQPTIYKDPNHKPEMAIAITPFHALCGFRPLQEIAVCLNTTPELKAFLPPAIVTKFLSTYQSSTSESKESLKDLFSSLMTAEEPSIHATLDTLVKRYASGVVYDGEEKDIVDLILLLNEQFPRDIGILCVFVLNYVHLIPGEAIFLGAGEPHAYIGGECIECMANSDNVIRAGLTPKLRDIPNLLSGLTYIPSPPSQHVVKPEHVSPATMLYNPPVPEFSVLQLKLPAGKAEVQRSVNGPSICIITEGSGELIWGEENTVLEIVLGEVIFVGAGTEIKYVSCRNAELVVYRAFVE